MGQYSQIHIFLLFLYKDQNNFQPYWWIIVALPAEVLYWILRIERWKSVGYEGRGMVWNPLLISIIFQLPVCKQSSLSLVIPWNIFSCNQQENGENFQLVVSIPNNSPYFETSKFTNHSEPKSPEVNTLLTASVPSITFF